MHRRARTALVAAFTAALTLPAPAPAPAALVDGPDCARAIPGQQTMPVAGDGFRRGGLVTIQASGQTLGTATADQAGRFLVNVEAPRLAPGRFDRTFELTATDDQGTAAPPVEQRVVLVGARLPDRARPSSRVRYRVYGFVDGRDVYVHIRRDGRTRGSFKIGRASSPCGIATRRMRSMPLERWRSGTYRYVFQHTRRYDPDEPSVTRELPFSRSRR